MIIVYSLSIRKATYYIRRQYARRFIEIEKIVKKKAALFGAALNPRLLQTIDLIHRLVAVAAYQTFAYRVGHHIKGLHAERPE
jgi:hypothetical protein